MKRTWMPRAAGILCIIAGVLIVVIPVIVVAVNVGGLMKPSPMDGYGVFILFLFFGPLIILLIIVGIFAVVGGIYALKRRRWGLALAGSICVLIFGIALGGIGALFASVLASVVLAFVVFAGLALLPLIFVILGKREFK